MRACYLSIPSNSYIFFFQKPHSYLLCQQILHNASTMQEERKLNCKTNIPNFFLLSRLIFFKLPTDFSQNRKIKYLGFSVSFFYLFFFFLTGFFLRSCQKFFLHSKDSLCQGKNYELLSIS